jgi:photosystem II stability/assembly factor-like uncharacterized protein
MALVCLAAAVMATPVALWKVGSVGVVSNLRGVSVCIKGGANEKAASKAVVWVTGSKGTVMRSVDEGEHWEARPIAGAGELDFRGVQAFGERTAYVMSSGEGGKSRIYKTTDGGASWEMQYTDERAGFFLDAIACTDERHCLALSDPVEGKFLLVWTEDGKKWTEMPRGSMPAALKDEGAFAASNSSLVVSGEDIYFATGGGAARVFHSADLGKTWKVFETPIAHGQASQGIFSIFLDGGKLLAVGGDYKEPTRAEQNAAISTDGGEHWTVPKTGPSGYRSAVSKKVGEGYFAVGTSGMDFSADGLVWTRLAGTAMNAIDVKGEFGVAAGPGGAVALITKTPTE